MAASGVASGMTVIAAQYLGGAIAFIKISNIIWGYVSKKQFISLHNITNKITGLLLFILPLTLSFIDLKYSSIVVCSIATFAAFQEGFYIATNFENTQSKSDL